MMLLWICVIFVTFCSVKGYSLVPRSGTFIKSRAQSELYANPARPASRHPDDRRMTGNTKAAPSSSNSKYAPKKVQYGNRPEETARQTWKTGETLVRTQSNRGGNGRRNDPWWMRDDESNNPAILPSYRPWWAMKYKPANADMKLNDLRDLARARGISGEGLKNDVLNRLQEQERMFSLHDDNFRAPEFSDAILLVSESCYPESYETAAAE